MAVEEKKAIIQRFVAAFNQGDLGAFDRLMAEEYYNHAPEAGEEHANAVFGRLAGDLLAAVPDLQLSVAEFSDEEEDIAFDLTMTGTHSATLWGAPPSGEEITWTSTVAARFIDGRFAVSWPDLPLRELLGTMRQANLVPPPEDMDKPHKHPVSPPEILLKVVFTGQVGDKPCSHLDKIKVVDPATDVCEQCVAMGDEWPALRMCLICGFVGCCDTSKNKHAKAHFEETGHALIRSIRLEESWVWCYEDSAFFLGEILEKYR